MKTETFMPISILAEFFILKAEILMCDLAQQLRRKSEHSFHFALSAQVFLDSTLPKVSCMFECFYEFVFGENTTKHYFNGTRNQSNAM